MPDGYVTLMKACWNEDPNERPPFEDIVNYLRSLYLEVKNGSGQSRDPRRSLDLKPVGLKIRQTCHHARHCETNPEEMPLFSADCQLSEGAVSGA